VPALVSIDKITPFNPPPPPTKSDDEIVSKSAEEVKHEMNEKQRAAFVKNAGVASLAAFAFLAFGFNADSPETISLLSTFALAGLAGYQVVWGVAPALHSPLMAGELRSRMYHDSIENPRQFH
jgi:NAD/NADP transhydrogenase alpha subunit